MCFPLNFARFLSTPILKNIRKRLLLNITISKFGNDPWSTLLLMWWQYQFCHEMTSFSAFPSHSWANFGQYPSSIFFFYSTSNVLLYWSHEYYMWGCTLPKIPKLSSYFLVWKFCGDSQFPQSLWRINKISTPEN